MKARSVARELALFALFQMDKKGSKLQWDKMSLEELVVNTVRTLSGLAEEQIGAVLTETTQLRDYMVDYEIDHPVNESVPVDAPTLPVPIPTTLEMREKLDALIQSVQNLQEALYLPEMKALSSREDVHNYCRMLVRLVSQHQAEIDELINQSAVDWRVDRLQKMDLALLRLAVAELRFEKHTDTATVIDEILELATQFTDEESRKFIHGILGAIAEVSAGAGDHV